MNPTSRTFVLGLLGFSLAVGGHPHLEIPEPINPQTPIGVHSTISGTAATINGTASATSSSG